MKALDLWLVKLLFLAMLLTALSRSFWMAPDIGFDTDSRIEAPAISTHNHTITGD